MYLSKKETVFRFSLLLCITSSSVYSDINLGILSGIKDNTTLYLNDMNTPTECLPFGIKTLEQLLKEEGANSECGKSIEAYFVSHPHEKKFAKEHLHLHQRYHYEKSSKGCILYSNGPESYSEQLLNEGLAIIDPKFDDQEWNTKLRRAHTRAKVLKKGIFEGEMATKCIKGEDNPR